MWRLDLPARAERVGAILAGGLGALNGVVEVRGRGLMLGAQLEAQLPAAAVVTAALERGLIVNAVASDTVRWVPPLTVTEDEIAEAVAIFAEAIASATRDQRG
jgi:acetylornithine aminotransferase